MTSKSVAFDKDGDTIPLDMSDTEEEEHFGQHRHGSHFSSNRQIHSLGEEMREETPPHRGLGSKPPQKKKRNESLAPAPLSKNFGKFAGTGGLGLSMLMNMGYKPGEGLGASKQGRIEPIQAVRRKFIGEGLNEQSSSSDDQSRQEKRSSKSAAGAPEIRKPADHYKKSSTSRRKKTTAKDIVAREELFVEKVTTIIDMRSGSASALTPSSFVSRGSSVTQYQLTELLQSMTLLANTSRNGLTQRAQRRIRDREELKATNKRQHALEEAHKSSAAQIQLIETILVRFVRPLQLLSIESVTEIVDYLKAVQPQLPGIPLDGLLVALVAPGLRALLSNWDPLNEPDHGLDILQAIRPVAHVLPLVSTAPAGSTQISLATELGSEKRNRPTHYDSLLWHTWLPRVRSALQSSWNVYQPAPVLELLGKCYPQVITLHIFNFFIYHIIIPRLQTTINSWNPQREASFLTHSDDSHALLIDWFFPWFGDKSGRGLEAHLLDVCLIPTLFPMITHKLGQWFAHWNPIASSGDIEVEAKRMDNGIAQLIPWAQVWSRDVYASFAAKHVVPKLAQYLDARLVINPADQSLAPIDLAITKWIDSLSPALLVQILMQGGFFQQWLDVLHQWLTVEDPAQRNLGEVAQWYQTWKSAFPSSVVSDSRATVWFAFALDMMRHAASGDAVPLPTVLAGLNDEQEAASRGQAKASSRSNVAPAMTFREIVERDLSTRGLLLLPTGITHASSGRAISRVVVADQQKGRKANVYIYMDQSVLFLHNSAPGASLQAAGQDPDALWLPCDVDAIAQAANR